MHFFLSGVEYIAITNLSPHPRKGILMKNIKHVVLSLVVSILLIFVLYSCVDHDLPGPVTQKVIEGVAQVDFPKGSINSENVTFEKINSLDAEYIFDETAELFRVGSQLPYQVKLDIGSNPPQNDNIKITFFLPKDFVNGVPKNFGIELFAQIYQDGGMETLDLFDILSSQYNPSEGTLTATLPTYVFTNERNSQNSYEAIFVIGATPGKNAGLRQSAILDDCDAFQISCPLGQTDVCVQMLTSKFNKRKDPITGKDATHWGVDFGIINGTAIYSASDGVIEKIATERNRETGVVKGYGLYVIVRHTNKSATLYAHLNSVHGGLTVGSPVKQNQQIAVSDNSGRTTGPHLHFEYVPNGEIIASKSRINPFPCISTNQNGSITIRDNGNLADDAFSLYLNNVFVGKTEIGASNSVALSNLRPGESTLKLVCDIAPDNVGTYEVLLNDGILFKTGGNRKSSTLPQGGSIEWVIIIPNTGNKAQPSLVQPTPIVSQPNSYIEM